MDPRPGAKDTHLVARDEVAESTTVVVMGAPLALGRTGLGLRELGAHVAGVPAALAALHAPKPELLVVGTDGLHIVTHRLQGTRGSGETRALALCLSGPTST